jgi:hypothetical protein
VTLTVIPPLAVSHGGRPEAFITESVRSKRRIACQGVRVNALQPLDWKDVTDCSSVCYSLLRTVFEHRLAGEPPNLDQLQPQRLDSVQDAVQRRLVQINPT